MSLNGMASVILAGAFLAGPTVAFGQSAAAQKPLAKMTCEEFVGFDDSFKPKLVYWGVAYGRDGKPESAGVNVAGIERIVPIVVESCKMAPRESFWERVKAEVKMLEKKL
ncbi:MAG TPA: HdeA/HdeB family chaperone [Methylomirabilota bacterium]|nr:HdeA/HdeB family chaperone [Methylomirabilota bacterium]